MIRNVLISDGTAVGTPSNAGDVPNGAIAFFDQDGNFLDPATDYIGDTERFTVVLGGDTPLVYTYASNDIVDTKKVDHRAEQPQIITIGYNGSSGSISFEEGTSYIRLTNFNRDDYSNPINQPYDKRLIEFKIKSSDTQETIADKIKDAIEAADISFVDSVETIDDAGGNFGVQITFTTRESGKPSSSPGTIAKVNVDEKLDGTAVSEEDGNAQLYDPGQGNGLQVKDIEEGWGLFTRGAENRTWIPPDYTRLANVETDYDTFLISIESEHSESARHIARTISPFSVAIFYPEGGANIGDVQGPVIDNA